MGLLKRNRQEIRGVEKEVAAVKMADKIAGLALRIQVGLSSRINAMLINIGVKKLKWTLFIFMFSGGGVSAYLIVHSLLPIENNKSVVKPTPFSVPKLYENSGEETISTDARIDEQTLDRLNRFEAHMESLKKNNINSYDSFMRTRPGLMDSLRVIQKFYNSKQINKKK